MTSSPPLPTSATPPPKPFQFSLQQLLLAMLGCAVLFAITTQLGLAWLYLSILAASPLILLYGAIRRNSWFLVGLAGLVIGVWLCLPTLGPHVSSARRLQCGNHLKDIAAALDAYHTAKGTFPPAYLADSNGRPIHSWRVLILPYLGRNDLYARYNFNEPWNGPNNRKLLAEMPHEFGCPSEPGPMSGRTETSYLAVVGPGTVWPCEKAVSMSQILDGTSSTLLVVEVHDSGIAWLEPRDLHISQMPMAINPPRGQSINSRHGSKDDHGRGNGTVAVFCDGHTQFLPNTLSPKTLRAALTIAGGETVNWDDD